MSDRSKFNLLMVFVLIVVATVFAAVIKGLSAIERKPRGIITQDVDEARKYQRKCLNRGGSAYVQVQITGIQVTCSIPITNEESNNG